MLWLIEGLATHVVIDNCAMKPEILETVNINQLKADKLNQSNIWHFNWLLPELV